MTSFSHPPELIAAICAHKGYVSAAIVGESFGLTRNAVIGIWNRHSKKKLDKKTRWALQSAGTVLSYKRRRAARKADAP